MNIVTGFVSNINQRGDRDLSKYIAFGIELMSVEIPMTVFIEKRVFDEYILPKITDPLISEGVFTHQVIGGFMDNMQFTYSYSIYGHIRFVFFEKRDLFLWPYKSLAHRFSLNTGNPTKDTLEYMIVQCQKSEWVSIAASLCNSLAKTHSAKEYVWVDFGAFHMFKGKIDVFQIELYKMRNRINRRLLQYGESNKIVIARCWDPSHPLGNIYRDVNWTFAGSVFGCCKKTAIIFANKMREKCLQIMRERNTLMWEINVWTLIFQENPDLFSLYPSDHNDILFAGYA